MSKLDGRCLCGAVTYTSQAEPAFTAVCHCRDCQRQTGTAFSVVVGVPAESFELKGELSEHVTIGEDHGLETKRRFCPTCGSPVMSEADAMPEVIFIKAGTLDDPSWLAPNLHIWCAEKLPWVGIPEGATEAPANPG